MAWGARMGNPLPATSSVVTGQGRSSETGLGGSPHAPSLLVKVRMDGDCHRIRLLFPSMAIASVYPVYAEMVFSPFAYEFPANLKPSLRLFLLLDDSGFNLESMDGLCAFLRRVGYMTEHKVSRLSRLEEGIRREADSSSADPVSLRFREAISLKVGNLSFLEDSGEDFRVADLLKLSEYDRLRYCAECGGGYERALYQLLTLFSRFYGRDASKHYSRQYQQMLSQMLVGFRVDEFLKGYRLTGDAEADCVALLAALPPPRAKAW